MKRNAGTLGTLLTFCLMEAEMDIAPLNDILAQWGGHGWGMGPGMMGWGYGMGWLGMIIMAAFWIALIVGIVLLIRWLVISTRAGGHAASSGDSPLEILKRRYARGEINKEEFEEKKKDLGY